MAKQRDLSALVGAKRQKEEEAASASLRQDAETPMRQDAPDETKRKHFRVEKRTATRFAILAKERDTTETALLHEAIDLLFEKYGVNVPR